MSILPFQYDPLPKGSFHRLLRLCPGNQEQQLIVCELVTTKAPANDEANSPYRALSYCWGSNHRDTPILLRDNQSNREGVLGVTENLHAFLSTTAVAEDHGWFFVDAVCINQEDLKERARQISFMSEIYKSASKVVVWLGEDPEICYFLRWLREYMQEHWIERRDGTRDVKFEKTDIVAALKHDEQFKQGYRSISEHDYWTRLWIIPEFRLGKAVDLQCYQETLEWIALYKSLLETNVLRLTGASHELEELGLTHAHNEKPGNMLEIVQEKRVVFSDALRRFQQYLKTFQRQRCSDLRDRVYALLPLISDGAGFLVSYQIGTIQLFLDTYVAFYMKYWSYRPEVLLQALDLDLLSVLEWASKIQNGSQVITVSGSFIQPGNNPSCDCRCPLDFGSQFRKENFAIWCGLRAGIASVHVLMQASENSAEGDAVSDRLWSARGLLENDGTISVSPQLDSECGELALQLFNWSTVRVIALHEFGFNDRRPEFIERGGWIWKADFNISYFGLAVLLRAAQLRGRNLFEHSTRQGAAQQNRGISV